MADQKIVTETALQAIASDIKDALDAKADKSTTYTKSEVDSALAFKADAEQVDYMIEPVANTPTDVASSSLFTKQAGYNAGVESGTKIKIVTLSGYDTYVFEIRETSEIYFEGILPDYVALCHGVAPYTHQEGSNYYYCTSATRYRNRDNNLPTASNKLSVNAGDIIAITITENTTITIVGIETTYIFTDEAKEQILSIIPNGKTPLVQYNGIASGANTERLNIYLPCGVGYTRFNFEHYISVSKNANVWVIHPLSAVDDSLIDRFALTVDGEFECALQIDGAPDFMGGSAHGSEINNYICVYVDGKEVTPSSLTDLTPFETLRIVEQSNLYDPRDETTLVALHGKEYIFTKDKLIINQTVVWQQSETLTTSYLAMLPVSKSVISNFIGNNNYNKIDLSSSIPLNLTDVDNALSWGNNNGFSVRFAKKIWDIKGANILGDDTFKITDNSGHNYYKQYFVACSSGDVSANDVWKSSTEYQFEINQ